MRNTNKYTKLYSGGTPIFIEDNIFRIIIPMKNVVGLRVGPSADKETDKENSKENSKEIIIDILETYPEISMKEISGILNVTTGKVRYYIDMLKKSGRIEYKGSTKKGKWIVHKLK